MSDAVVSVGATCIRIDKEYFQVDIVQELRQDIKERIAIIADISEANPNVLYEVCFSHGVGRPAIHLCSTPLEKLPFDLKTWKTISYKKGQTYALKGKLAKALKKLSFSQDRALGQMCICLFCSIGNFYSWQE